MNNLATAGIGNELHMIYLDDKGDIYHRIRHADGVWSQWGKIAGGQFTRVSCAGVGQELHVTAVNRAEVWYHAIRHRNEQWQGFAQLPDQPLLNE